MYQSPDFVKVDLDIKDNFAAYSSCYRMSGAGQVVSEAIVGAGVICRQYEVITYQPAETDYQCFLGKNGY